MLPDHQGHIISTPQDPKRSASPKSRKHSQPKQKRNHTQGGRFTTSRNLLPHPQHHQTGPLRNVLEPLPPPQHRPRDTPPVATPSRSHRSDINYVNYVSQFQAQASKPDLRLSAASVFLNFVVFCMAIPQPSVCLLLILPVFVTNQKSRFTRQLNLRNDHPLFQNNHHQSVHHLSHRLHLRRSQANAHLLHHLHIHQQHSTTATRHWDTFTNRTIPYPQNSQCAIGHLNKPYSTTAHFTFHITTPTTRLGHTSISTSKVGNLLSRGHTFKNIYTSRLADGNLHSHDHSQAPFQRLRCRQHTTKQPNLHILVPLNAYTHSPSFANSANTRSSSKTTYAM